ncbi:MAG: transporter substrate-binding domain-containing protein [Spirochaetes bacterium]|nr:transporter substrate-binding domain-containing protein [Spirochaetota bacterium]
MSKKLTFILILILLFTCFLGAQKKIVLTNGEWEPYLSEHLKHYGVASHIVTEAFAQEGVKVEYVFVPWKRAFEDAKSGKYDGSLVWTKSAEREKDFYFSEPVIRGDSVFFYIKGNKFDWKTLKDLTKYKMGVALGYKYAFDDDPISQQFKREEAPNDLSNFKKLLGGRIDIYPLSKDVGWEMINGNFSKAEIKKFASHPKPYHTENYYLILTKAKSGNADLIRLFDKGLAKLKKSGKYDKFINDSYKGKYK